MNRRLLAAGKRMNGRNYVRTAGGEWIEIGAAWANEKAR